MALILNMDTATGVCSVALAKDGESIAFRTSEITNSHSVLLTTFINEVMRDAGFFLSDLDAIAINEGPGSYTGLRIGVASAKGLCYALNKPLIGVSGLKSMAVGMTKVLSEELKVKSEKLMGSKEGRKPILFCPMVDARRMEVYCSIFDQELNTLMETRAEIVEEKSFSGYFEDHIVVLAGYGATKCKTSLENHPNAIFLDQFKVSAEYMTALAEEQFNKQNFQDIAYFEPFYLKDFVAGKPRVKGLD